VRPSQDDVFFLDPALPAAAQLVIFEARGVRGPAGGGSMENRWG